MMLPSDHDHVAPIGLPSPEPDLADVDVPLDAGTLAQVLSFFAALYAMSPPHAFVEVHCWPPDQDDDAERPFTTWDSDDEPPGEKLWRERTWFHVARPRAAIAEALRWNALGYTSCIGVNPRHTRGGKAEHVLHVAAVVLDFDTPERSAHGLAALARANLTPSILVASGRPEARHVYLLLDKPYPPAEAYTVARRVKDWTRSDHVHAPSRVMRMPASINSRSGARCTVLDLDPGRRYSLHAIDAALEAAGAPSDLEMHTRRSRERSEAHKAARAAARAALASGPPVAPGLASGPLPLPLVVPGVVPGVVAPVPPAEAEDLPRGGLVLSLPCLLRYPASSAPSAPVAAFVGALSPRLRGYLEAPPAGSLSEPEMAVVRGLDNLGAEPEEIEAIFVAARWPRLATKGLGALRRTIDRVRDSEPPPLPPLPPDDRPRTPVRLESARVAVAKRSRTSRLVVDLLDLSTSPPRPFTVGIGLDQPAVLAHARAAFRLDPDPAVDPWINACGRTAQVVLTVTPAGTNVDRWGPEDSAAVTAAAALGDVDDDLLDDDLDDLGDDLLVDLREDVDEGDEPDLDPGDLPDV